VVAKVRASLQQRAGDRAQHLAMQKAFPSLHGSTAEKCKRNMEVRADVIT